MGYVWARRNDYRKEKYGWENGSTTSPSDLSRSPSLAILNHSACTQIHQYAKSGSELSKLMLSESRGSLEDELKFKERVQ